MTFSDSNRAVAVVTGARGFIGGSVAAEFAAAGYRVIGVDRCAGSAGAHSVEHVCLQLPGEEFDALLAAEEPTVLVHAAGPASVADSLTNPLGDFTGTVGVLATVLDAVRRVTPATRLVVTSSAAVYGDPATLPIREDAERAPVSPYGFHKCLAEDLLVEYAHVYGVRCCAARIFSAYGAGLKRQLLWDVCLKAAAADEIGLFGTGEETRDFVHASDVASAIRILSESAAMDGEAYNVASGQQTSIADLVGMLLPALGESKTACFSGEQRLGDPLYWEADISKLRRLGFEPRVPLANGVAEYARWFVDEAAR